MRTLVYTVWQKRPPFYFFEQLCQKLTDFNDFRCVKSWGNLTSVACTFADLAVYCSQFTLGNPKKSFSTALFTHTHTSDYLRYINARKLNSLKHCVISQITRLRLDACIHAECGHFEQLLWHGLPDIPVATHHNNWFFSEPPTSAHNRLFTDPPTFYLQSDEKVVAFAVTFFRCGGCDELVSCRALVTALPRSSSR